MPQKVSSLSIEAIELLSASRVNDTQDKDKSTKGNKIRQRDICAIGLHLMYADKIKDLASCGARIRPRNQTYGLLHIQSGKWLTPRRSNLIQDRPGDLLSRF